MSDFDLKSVLQRITAGEILSQEEANTVLSAIADERVDPYQTAAFLMSYQMRAITGEELAGFRQAMMDRALLIDLSDMDTIDVCGTGGDGKNTFNISTVSAFVVAGAGYKVAKHGNSSVSSACGSSDVLKYLGYEFSNDRDLLRADLDKGNFCYMHAPLFHPVTMHIGAMRKALKIKTFFNLMGPLLHPAMPRYQLAGVYSPKLLPLFKTVLGGMGVEYGIVHAIDGYDEVSLTGDYHLWTPSGDHTISPSDMDLPTVDASALYGGDTVEEAAKILLGILSGDGTPAQNAVVKANAALAIQRFDTSKSIADCVAEAEESIASGQALQMLKAVTA